MRMTAEMDQRASELVAAGASHAAAARQVGVTDKAIGPAVVRHRARNRAPDQRERIAQLWVQLADPRRDRAGDRRRVETDDREQDLLILRVLSEHPLSLEDLAADWGVSRQRAWQIEQKLLDKLEAKVLGKCP